MILNVWALTTYFHFNFTLFNWPPKVLRHSLTTALLGSLLLYNFSLAEQSRCRKKARRSSSPGSTGWYWEAQGRDASNQGPTMFISSGKRIAQFILQVHSMSASSSSVWYVRLFQPTRVVIVGCGKSHCSWWSLKWNEPFIFNYFRSMPVSCLVTSSFLGTNR